MSIAFVFPGQGSQYVGMGRDLAQNYPEAAECFSLADEALGFDLSRVCFEGPEEALLATDTTQPAILTASVAAFRVLEAHGVMPSLVAGHSLGEYSALVAAGAISFADALRLVRRRGQLMAEAAPAGGGMAAILGLSGDQVAECCRKASSDGVVEVANYNSPGQVVVSGEAAALQKAGELAKEAGASRVVPLSVAGPFHSSLMRRAADVFVQYLAAVDVSAPRMPIVANVTADYARTADEVRENLSRQITGSVRWEESVARMVSSGITTFVEVGPGKVLSGLVRRIDRQTTALNAEDAATCQKVLDFFKAGD